MRILHVTNTFYPAWAYGGIARVAYELCKKLVDRGHEVTVFTTDAYNKSSRIKYKDNPDIVDGIKIYRFRNISNWLAWKRYHLPLSLVPATRRGIKEFDVIQIHGSRSTMHIPVCYYAKKYGIPYVIDPHGSILRRDRKQGLKTILDIIFGYRILRDAYKVNAGTEVEIDEAKSMGVDDEKIIQLLPGYDVNYFSDLPALGQFREKFGIKEKKIILFLGRIHEIKGIDFLVKSFYELTRSRDDVVLVIAGPDDGYKPTIKKLINELHLSNNVLFTGVLDGEEKLSAYVDASIFVQPSKYERFCGSPFEAILCDTPIIVTKNTGCGNFVHKMDMGYTVDYGDVNELRNTVEGILSDSSETHVKTQRCKEYIINNLTWEKQIKKYEKLYLSAIEGIKNGMENNLV